MRKVVSYGGGVNGVAMAIAMVRAGDRPDAILFADTGGEEPRVYEHIRYFSDWLISKGFPPITFVTYKTKKGKRVTLEEEVLKAKTLPSVVFGFKTCSQKHKIAPQHKWVKYHWGKESVTWYVGFDANEARRVKTNPEPNYTNKYPLIELGWDRSECINQIKLEGVKVPGKSACFFCRNRTKEEIRALDQSLQQRAIAMERNAKENLHTVKGLGGRWSWEDFLSGQTAEADQDEKDQQAFKQITGEQRDVPHCECI